MKGCLTVLFIILAIALVINFPFFIIGVAVTIVGIYAYRKNKKENVKSKLAPAVLILGIVLTLVSCAVTIADDEDAEQAIVTDNVQKQEVDSQKNEATVDKKTGEKDQSQKTAEEKVENKVPADKADDDTSADNKTNNVVTPKENTSENKSINTSGTTAQIPVTLVKTIDGDTIKIMYEGKEVNVRYLLIDTPETSHPQLGKQPFGEEAKERNRQLVNSGKLTIEFDVGERVDKYDRLLAYVYVDGKSVQKTLLAEGLARVAYVYPPNTRHLTPYEEAQASAKKNKLGIWSVENYATESGFNTTVVPKPSTTAPSNSTSNPTTSKPSTSTSTNSTPSTATEWYQNCTELRKVHPNGVPKGHPAYQAKMDRDKDNYACER